MTVLPLEGGFYVRLFLAEAHQLLEPPRFGEAGEHQVDGLEQIGFTLAVGSLNYVETGRKVQGGVLEIAVVQGLQVAETHGEKLYSSARGTAGKLVQMSASKRIDSAQNPEIKAVSALKDRRARVRENRFLIEGAREIARAYSGGIKIEKLYFCPQLLNDEGRGVLEDLSRAALEQIEVSPHAFERLSMRENPDGLVALAFPLEGSLSALELPEQPLLLILEGLEKPGNVGALLRTADGVGVDAVIVVGQTDLMNPNVVRSSQGSLFTQPVVNCQLPELLEFIRARDIALVAATPYATTDYWDADLRGGVAIALGTEHEGLSKVLLEAAGVRVNIPMRGAADSLNVGIAGALLLYEAVRQRRG